MTMERRHWERFAGWTVPEFQTKLGMVAGDMVQLLTRKRLSYGPHNLTKFGDLGVLVRTSDKLERLVHMYQEGIEVTAVGEDMIDAWRDIVGYGLLVLTAHAGDNDGQEEYLDDVGVQPAGAAAETERR